MNPLLEKFDTAPFSKINEKHYKPAIQKAIEIAREDLQKIIENKEEASFENTIEALDSSGDMLGRITTIFFNINSAETNEEIQAIAQEVSPWLTEFKNDMMLNEALFERVKAVFKQKQKLDLTAEQEMLLDKNYKSFVRNGANLTAEDKEKLRAIDVKLSQLTLRFGENVLADTNAYEMLLTDERDLSGLPEGVKEAAKELAKQKEKEGWLFTLDYPSYIPFVTYADNRQLRKKITIAAGRKGFQLNENNNQHIVLDIVSLRCERAKLLGYQSHADYVLEERMAENKNNVFEFLENLLTKAKPAAQKEFQRLEQFAKQTDNIDRLEKWDNAYYSEKLKKELFSLDQELLKPYFKLENVIKGVFEVSKRLYGLHFEEIDTIDKYHEDVLTYKVSDEQGNFVSYLYADFHPRKGKRNGAWMTSYKSQYIEDGVNVRPHVSIVCNFTKPTQTKPSLLTFGEVTTLFHEFGHALHGMLANTTYRSLSGTSVMWDFVELPSQLLENWCYEKDALELFAKHYETDEVIPMEYIEKIKESAVFNEGMQTLRQLSFGLLDMYWHSHQSPNTISSVKEFENKAFESTQLYPNVDSNCMSTAFSHIFQGGYSSGYYSYKWAEVLDADTFEYFKENRIFNKTISEKFKNNILSKGGSEKPMTLYKRFRGKEPNSDALLRRAGLLN